MALNTWVGQQIYLPNRTKINSFDSGANSITSLRGSTVVNCEVDSSNNNNSNNNNKINNNTQAISQWYFQAYSEAEAGGRGNPSPDEGAGRAAGRLAEAGGRQKLHGGMRSWVPAC